MQDGINHDALHAYLSDHIDGFEGNLSVNAFAAGQSNPTYLLETPTKKYVLRRKPSGKLLPSAHAVDREYRVMTALGKVGFPVPKTYLYAEEPDVVETPFFVMDFVEGRVFFNSRMPEQSPDERRQIFESINSTMAQLHALDPNEIGLGDYGKQGDYFTRQIRRWSKQYKASETDDIPEMDKLIAWLPDNIPVDDTESRVIHGDFGLHNIMFHPIEPRIVAVLDWELSTLGHPIADLTYNMMPWYAPHVENVMVSFQGLDLEAHGVPSFEAYMGRYCERTGRDTIEKPDFFKAYNLFRLGAIAQGIVARAIQGNASNPQAMKMREFVRPLAQMSWQFAQQAGAR